MAIVTQNPDEIKTSETVSSFMRRFGIAKLLARCGAYKEKGISVLELFLAVFHNVFSDRSMYRQMKTGRVGSRILEKHRLSFPKLREDQLGTLHRASLRRCGERPAPADERKEEGNLHRGRYAVRPHRIQAHRALREGL